MFFFDFDLYILLRARKATGTFEKRAPGSLVSLAAVFVSSRNAPLQERYVTRQKRLLGRLKAPQWGKRTNKGGK